MAIQKSFGVTDTAIEGVTEEHLARALLNFAVDWRVKSISGGKEIVLTNITAPPDRPEKIRMQYTEIGNIYNGSGIEPSFTAPSKRGVQLLGQTTNVLTVTDDANLDFRIDLPFSIYTVLKVPISAYVTATELQTALCRHLSAFYETGSITTDRLNSLLRGVLSPSDM